MFDVQIYLAIHITVQNDSVFIYKKGKYVKKKEMSDIVIFAKKKVKKKMVANKTQILRGS